MSFKVIFSLQLVLLQLRIYLEVMKNLYVNTLIVVYMFLELTIAFLTYQFQ